MKELLRLCRDSWRKQGEGAALLAGVTQRVRVLQERSVCAKRVAVAARSGAPPANGQRRRAFRGTRNERFA